MKTVNKKRAVSKGYRLKPATHKMIKTIKLRQKLTHGKIINSARSL